MKEIILVATRVNLFGGDYIEYNREDGEYYTFEEDVVYLIKNKSGFSDSDIHKDILTTHLGTKIQYKLIN